MKLWTTNGVIAELLVVMAAVPKHDGGRGGITAFVVEGNADGMTVENRNAFMGLAGIENGVTRFHQVRVPAANRLGKEGEGLKIALTTLNTGRLSIPAMCTAAGKWCTKIAREWSAARVQWGKPVAEHEAVATKLSFMAATTFGLEAVLDLSSQLADSGAKDIRIEAALAKLWASEMAWKIADELVQIRGGRGFETADSMAARGERAVPAEQILRDLRINRIFEGSSEIMRLLIAREAVDAHLKAAGDLASPDADTKAKAKSAVKASGFYAGWLPKLVVGKGTVPTSYDEFGRLAKHLRFVERSSRKLARQTFYGMSRWQAKLEYRQAFLGRDRRHRGRAVRDGGGLLACRDDHASRTRSRALRRTSSPTSSASRRGCGSRPCSTGCGATPTPTTGWSHASCSTATTPGSRPGVLDQSEGTGPWISEWSAGASDKPNVHRAYR